MATVLVIGGGICGLGTAILLARDGHRVTVLERDAAPEPESPQEAWNHWSRKGVAQFSQPHNFMPGLRLLLEGELPDVQESLRCAGAGKLDLLNPLPPSIADRSPRAIDEKLWTYTARRPVGEWVFAAAARDEPGVEIERGTRVSGLLTGTPVLARVPHVVGVQTSSGREMRADLVIDAGGRASRTPKWLADLGAREPYEESGDFRFTYYTRYFQGDEPERRAPLLTPLGSISVLTLPGDNGTWSVTIFTTADDRQLTGLRDARNWTAVMRECPLHAHWLDGEPLGGSQRMGGVADRRRRFVVDGSPVATGLVPVADAWACTNPSAGRGMTVGMIHAVRLRDTLRETQDDPHALAMEFDRVTERDVEPWYRAQIAADSHRFAEMEAVREHRAPPLPTDELAQQILALRSAMVSDPDLLRAGLEYIATITPVQEILERPDVAHRLASTPIPPDAASREVPSPGRERLLELVG